MVKIVSLIAMNFVLLIMPMLAWSQQRGDVYGPHMMWGGWFFGPIMMIVLIAVAAIVVLLIVRWLGGVPHSIGPHTTVKQGESPLDILKERFARGEIDKDEFEERRRVLDD